LSASSGSRFSTSFRAEDLVEQHPKAVVLVVADRR